MSFKSIYIEWFVILLMNIIFFCDADEMTYNSTAPQNVKAVQVGKSDVLVTWDMPASRRIKHLTHRVFYAPVEDIDQWNSFDTSGSTAAIIGGLSRDETYTIRVSFVSPLGQGSMSLPVTVTVKLLGEYLISLDVRQIGAQNVLIQWDKLNMTEIELESVKRVVLNHKMSGSTTVDAHDVADWKTRTHFLLQDVDLNNKHTFQLAVLFELRSKSPIISKPVEKELVPRAPDESMLYLTADVDIYDLAEQQVQEYDRYYGSRYVTRTQCTRVSEENLLNTRRYDKIVTEKTKCNVTGKGEVTATAIKFFKDSSIHRKLAVMDDKILTWIMAHF